MNQSKALKQLKELKKYSLNPRLAAEGWDKDWKTLIATLMSARTKDDKTIPVAEKLFKKYNTVQKLANASYLDVAKIIKPINFYLTKSKRVVDCAKDLVENYKSKVPLQIEELIKLPGVGRKTANVFLAEQGQAAIGVDTHVGRISRKLGWTKQTNPDKVEEDLKNLFPKSKWRSINYILVSFGQSNRGKKEDPILDKIKLSF